LTYTLHPKAEDDLAGAVDFYEKEAGRIVADRFISEFERVANLLVEHPGLGTPASSGRKVFPLQIFPYSVVYRDIEGVVRILVVRHQHRKPGLGNNRR
jgi:plasmid stabilization system protein ParE